MEDWRLNGQERYLTGVKLKQISFNQLKKNSDHEHCEFCFEKIGNYPDCISKAYCTEDEYHWICDKCFNDFKDMFNWKLIE